MSDSGILDRGRESPQASEAGPAATADGAAGLPAGPAASAGPPPAALPGQEDVLGLRIAAALTDLVLLAAVFLIMSLSAGQADACRGVARDSCGGSLKCRSRW